MSGNNQSTTELSGAMNEAAQRAKAGDSSAARSAYQISQTIRALHDRPPVVTRAPQSIGRPDRAAA